MAEASKTTLIRKLAIPTKGDTKLVLYCAPDSFRLPRLPIHVRVEYEDERSQSKDPVAIVLAFFRQAAEIPPALDVLCPRIYPNGAIWGAWPRRATGHLSDITDNTIRTEALSRGLVDVKVAVLDDDWSGLRLVWRLEERTRPQ
jgi:hypothetical protein